MAEKDVRVNIKEEPSPIKNIAIGTNKEGFLLAFNCNENGVPEKTFSVEAQELSEIIGTLFECGMQYEKETGVDIGFGMISEGDEDDE